MHFKTHRQRSKRCPKITILPCQDIPVHPCGWWMSTRTLSCTHRTFSRVGFVCWLQREEKKKKSPSLAKNHTRQALGLYTQFLPTPLTRIIRAHIHYAYLSEVHDRKKEKAMFGCGHLNSGTDTNTMVGDAVQRARQHSQHAYHHVRNTQKNRNHQTFQHYRYTWNYHYCWESCLLPNRNLLVLFLPTSSLCNLALQIPISISNFTWVPTTPPSL